MILRSFVLIEKEGRYLLIREAGAKWRGKWFLPGGKLKTDELPETAAHREVKEEAGCNIVLNGIFFIRYTSGFVSPHLTIFYSAKITGEETIKQVPDKHSLEVKWFTPEEALQLPLRSNLAEVLKQYDASNLMLVHNFKIT